VDRDGLMRRAIELAWRGWGRVGANPLVGAVIVRDGAVVAEAHHAEFGGAHAETAALVQAGKAAHGATLVVTLEPCAHHGKTPPCADAIVKAGIRHVVFGARDPNTVAAGGAQVLARAGVVTEGGTLAAAVRAQNALFFHRHECAERPFVAVKLAVSVDGRIADAAGRSKWVSGAMAREYVQWLRAGFEAIAVGAGTARTDDPSLTVRGPVQPAAPPRRVVFDERGELPADRRLFATAREVPTTVVTGPAAVEATQARLGGRGVTVLGAAGAAAALTALRRQGVASVLVEGGGLLAARLLNEGLVDRLYLIQAPVFLGSGGVPAFPSLPDARIDAAPRWQVVERRLLDADTLIVMDRP
jgi:diaminohydroxyphosphoribosylaminopyrimidine deaminase / 5-amino-6-(5-phosphoribosylamino)uracil reductase